ncbi:MAG: glycogen/starch/alpha-glucan phosphorylase [Spirochaetaceae bacterium]|nr:glycogen/starch/alpha-glucan phosphorylase [Spirochaetaceae bacterium]
MEQNKQEILNKIKQEMERHLKHNFRRPIEKAAKQEVYDALAHAVMLVLTEKREQTREKQGKKGIKQAFYLSAEFLMGRALVNNLSNMGILDGIDEILKDFSTSIKELEEKEPDAALGNGGLGRLAACFLDSLATLDYPGHGYGIRYQYGMFKQKIENGYQVEYPDKWLANGFDVWEVPRHDISTIVEFGGTLVSSYDEGGNLDYTLEGAEQVLATPYDMLITGYGTDTVNRLRLWEASSPDGFNLQLFNDMKYTEAVQKATDAENISRVLYPNDRGPQGKELRLKQQYFFTSASIQDIVRLYVQKEGKDFSHFSEQVVIQLNDTHPVVAIPELMRILMDTYDFGWDAAWEITTKTFAYTNHTILAEALEKWPVELFRRLLPRIYQIIEEINRRFLIELRTVYPNDWHKHTALSIIEQGLVKMAWLAIVGSFSVNGVAALHTEILKTKELKDWYELYPAKFNNKTNGVTQRRWLYNANKPLAHLITKLLGSEDWVRDGALLTKLEAFVDTEEVLQELISIKKENKIKLAEYLQVNQNIFINPDSIFDVQIKRLHEYKRQLLNILHIMSIYNRILEDSSYNAPPQTFIFGAKSASGYERAKEIIKLITTVADRINNDYRVGGKLRVVFVENYCVSIAEKIFPASDISEQISTAGKEASGTGNMKFMMNGALTLGTLDGANIEIAEAVGMENAFIFGLTAEEVAKLNAEQANPHTYLQRNPNLARVVQQLVDGTYTAGTNVSFIGIYNSLMYGVDGQAPDIYHCLADFDEYEKIHEKALSVYTKPLEWAKMCLINIAKSGRFSSDRTITEYADDIWHLEKIQ